MGGRFSPAVLRRFVKEGRGTGIKERYIPWHQVRPSDPASQGRSHLINWRFNRLHHLLSDNELVAFGYATMLNLVDLREQYPLSLQTHRIEVSEYQLIHGQPWAPGTLEIAKDLRIKHPVVWGQDEVAPWVMTTDLVLTLADETEQRSILAVTVKDASELGNPRTQELLKIEREYWRRQGVPWLLITPDMTPAEAAKTMRGCMQWAVRPEIGDPSQLRKALQIAQGASWFDGMTMGEALTTLEHVLCVGRAECQMLFWTGVWAGAICLDFSAPLRPATRLRVLSHEQFLRQNPVAMGRTAWHN